MKRVYPIVVIALLAVLPRSLTAQSVLYVTSGNGNFSSLYTVNPSTGSSTLIGSAMSGSAQLTITGLASHPSTGVIYAILGSENTPARNLYTLDPLTAQGTLIGSFDPDRASDISFSPSGALFSWGTRGGPLGVINLSTADLTPIGAGANGTRSNGLAFTPDGTLYLAGPVDGGNLYTVNASTGALTVVAAFSSFPVGVLEINAMTSDANGLLYAVTRNSSNSMLLTINRSTAAVTLIGSLGFEADAITFASIPEPSTWSLMLLGGCLFTLFIRRIKTNRP